MDVFQWLFDGLGTMVVGLLIGGAVGATTGWNLAVRKSRRSQVQKGGDFAEQKQAGRDIK